MTLGSGLYVARSAKSVGRLKSFIRFVLRSCFFNDNRDQEVGMRATGGVGVQWTSEDKTPGAWLEGAVT